MRLGVLICLATIVLGCSRAYYRQSADRETYQAIGQHADDPRWSPPRIRIDVPPTSRLADPFDPDHPPMPPDDPAADRYMRCVNGMHGSRHWHDDGDAPWIEDPAWRSALSLNPEDELLLSPERAIGVALLNSRDYQTQLEQVYLNALALTLNRYEFYLHWFATNDTTFTHFGSGADESNTLNTSSTFGFTKAFAAGGQLLAEFANTFVFEFAGPDHAIAQSNLMVNFLQPLLRNGGRQFRLEGLTETERSLLYQLRTFSHYRKSFSFGVYTLTYLQLLLERQRIINQEANLVQLRQSLRLHEALLAAGSISNVDVDQVFLQYQSGQLTLLNLQTTLERDLDVYKLTLGMPPTLKIRLDESLLEPFQLNDPALTQVQDAMETLQAEFREPDVPPPIERMQHGLSRLWELHGQAVRLSGEVARELDRWRGEPVDADQPLAQQTRNQAAQKALADRLPLLRGELEEYGQVIQRTSAGLPVMKPADAWALVQKTLRQDGNMTADLAAIQTQIRVFLIKLRPVHRQESESITYALANRLDLMNQRGQVVDAWRQIAVTANQLKGEVNVTFNGNVATSGTNANPFDFRASASSYSVGLQFVAPLNREAERNAYRTSLINYQQARRSFMALEDQIAATIRNDLRNLETQRLSFEIARQSLLAAARAVEAARDRLLVAEEAAGTTLTLNLLNSLSGLLTAQQDLIGNWVSYETTRVQLLLDLDELQVDDRGLYVINAGDQSADALPRVEPGR